MGTSRARILLLAEMKSARLFWSLEWSSRHKGVSNKTKDYHISPQEAVPEGRDGCPHGVQLTLSGERGGGEDSTVKWPSQQGTKFKIK